MTGSRWLHRAREEYGDTSELLSKIKARITRKVRILTPSVAQDVLDDIGEAPEGSKGLLARWVGCWGYKLDAHLRTKLQTQAEKTS